MKGISGDKLCFLLAESNLPLIFQSIWLKSHVNRRKTKTECFYSTRTCILLLSASGALKELIKRKKTKNNKSNIRKKSSLISINVTRKRLPLSLALDCKKFARLFQRKQPCILILESWQIQDENSPLQPPRSVSKKLLAHDPKNTGRTTLISGGTMAPVTSILNLASLK